MAAKFDVMKLVIAASCIDAPMGSRNQSHLCQVGGAASSGSATTSASAGCGVALLIAERERSVRPAASATKKQNPHNHPTRCSWSVNFGSISAGYAARASSEARLESANSL